MKVGNTLQQKTKLIAKLNCAAAVLFAKLQIKISTIKHKDADNQSVLIQCCITVLHHARVERFKSSNPTCSLMIYWLWSLNLIDLQWLVNCGTWTWSIFNDWLLWKVDLIDLQWLVNCEYALYRFSMIDWLWNVDLIDLQWLVDCGAWVWSIFNYWFTVESRFDRFSMIWLWNVA